MMSPTLSKKNFTIINRNSEVNVKRAEFEVNLQKALKQQAPKTADVFERLPKPLRDAALSQTAPLAPIKWVRALKKAVPQQKKLLTEFEVAVRAAETHAEATTIGLIDLGARMSNLAQLIERLNGVQDKMVFIEVQTPVPAGMVKTGEALAKEFERQSGSPLPPEKLVGVRRNMLVNDFLTFADSVRARHELQRLIGITPAMLAFLEHGKIEMDYHTYGDCKLHPNALVSTYQLREFAERAGRPFEAAVGFLIVGQMIATRNDMPFHRDTRGCALDFNEDRASLVESIQGMRLDSECAEMLKQKDPEEARVADAMLSALRRMRRSKNV